ncbi:MAG: acyltransferase [Opitutae bacterium]|nr:acyltransferase [Opitutae bacterium]
MPRAAQFDGLRGLAISLVLWHHLVGAYLPSGHDSWLGWLKAGTDLAWCGVDLFFVLSGYFIGGILIDRWQSPRFARVFYLRRSVRILPLYLVTLAAIFLAIWAGWPGAYNRFAPWVYGLFLTNFGLAAGSVWDWGPLTVLWSLAVEEQFYLVAPWVVGTITPTRLGWLAALLVIVAPFVRIGLCLLWPEWHLAAHVLMPARMDTLACGVWIAWGVRSPAARPVLDWLQSRSLAVFAVSTCALGLLSALRFREGDVTQLWFGYSLIALTFAAVVALVTRGSPPGLIRLLSLQPLVALGRHSYSIYLWHMLIGVGVIRCLGGPTFVLNSFSGLCSVLLGFSVTWIAAAFSWKFLEAPLINWGHRHAY